MQGAHPQEVPFQRRTELKRKNCRPILAAFAVADRNRMRCKVEILDPQGDAFMHAQSGPIHQFGHQLAGALHHRQHALHLVPGQDHRHSLSTLDALETRHLAQGSGQNAVVEKDNCVQGLRLRRCGDAALHRQIVQKGFDLGRTHFRGMAFAVEQDELTNPVAIRLLGVAAEMATPADDGNLVEQAGTVGRGITP